MRVTRLRVAGGGGAGPRERAMVARVARLGLGEGRVESPRAVRRLALRHLPAEGESRVGRERRRARAKQCEGPTYPPTRRAYCIPLQGMLLGPTSAACLPCKFVSHSPPRYLCPIHVGRHPGRLRAAPVLWQPRSAGSACTQCRALASAAFAPAPSQVTQEELEREVRRYGPTSNVWVARNPAGFAFVVRPLAPPACLVLPAHR